MSSYVGVEDAEGNVVARLPPTSGEVAAVTSRAKHKAWMAGVLDREEYGEQKSDVGE